MNEEKNTPLHWACLNGHAEVSLESICIYIVLIHFFKFWNWLEPSQVVKKLILAGACVSNLNRYYFKPENRILFFFVMITSFCRCNLTLASETFSHERTPIDEAVSRGKMDIVDAINAAEAQVELGGVAVNW